MKTYIALLRGINVGGRNALPMKELIALLVDLGCKNVKTYIQSGNVVFRSPTKGVSALAREISVAVDKRRGFQPHVLILPSGKLERVVEANPFHGAEMDPKSLHLAFFDSVPSKSDLKKLNGLKAESEQYQLIDDIFYLHAPKGVGRSKLAANLERLLGVQATDRNWRTVCKIRDMARELC